RTPWKSSAVRRLAAAALAVAAAAVCAPAAQAAPALERGTRQLAVTSAAVEVSAPATLGPGFSIGELIGMSSTDIGRRLDAVRASGAKSIRFDVAWPTVQPTAGSARNWAPVDRVVSAANARGLQMLPIIDYTPAWARVPGCTVPACAPADPRAFAAFAGEVVQRYAPAGIRVWEVWNEPNVGSWAPRPDPAAYARLLVATSAEIKRRQPSATVVTGGLAPAVTVAGGTYSPQDFLKGVYDAGARASFDGVGMHPYCFPALPGEGQLWSGWTQMTKLREMMVARGDSAKGVWATEFGAPTTGPGKGTTAATRVWGSGYDHVDETMQAQTVKAAAAQLPSMPWLRTLMWYSYVDLGDGSVSNVNGYGLVRRDGTAKPALAAWVNATRGIL
ncbi:glycoside hydrolase 5 family protein, partial [Kineococcus indalonis]|uniref:cellulase family glycosylhydrolase n=1 Tax=Kineococcus indalonis TaxID=2696566 RepID=UPI001412648F